MITLGPTIVTRTDEGPSPFSIAFLGGKFTATTSFYLTDLWTKAGDGGFVVGVRLCVYEALPFPSAKGILQGFGIILGGFAALQVRSVELDSPIYITAGRTYYMCAQAPDNTVWLATSAQSFQFNSFSAFAIGPPNVIDPISIDGPGRCSMIWGTGEIDPPVIPFGGGAIGGTNALRLSEIMKLPCFHPCVPNAKKGPKINV